MGLRSKQRWRDEAVSQVGAAWLEEQALRGPILVVDDEAGDVEALCEDRGLSWTRWRRLRRVGVEPLPWPPEGPFAEAFVRLPKGREALEMTLHAVGSRLEEGGRVWVVGANDEGIRSTGKRAEPVFEQVQTVDTRKHCRVVELARPRPGLRAALEDWATTSTAELPDGPLTWISFPGVFAHGRLDEGTRVLLQDLPTLEPGQRALDFACGAGLIGKVLLRRSTGARVDLLDIDALAVEAARRNVPEAERVLASDGWEAVGDARYHLVISNPPLHAGKGSDYRVVQHLIEQAPDHLVPGGALRIVTQKTVPLRDLLRERFGEAELVREVAGYRIWEARRPR